MADFSPERSGFEPELGGFLRDSPDRTGFEPELGGLLRQKAVYVDEVIVSFLSFSFPGI